MDNEINLFEILLAGKLIGGGGGSSQKHTDILEGVTNINWENAQNAIELIPLGNIYKFDIEVTLTDGVSKGYAAHAANANVSIDALPIKAGNIGSVSFASYFSFGSSDEQPTKSDFSLKAPIDCSGISIPTPAATDYTLNNDGSVIVNIEIDNGNEEVFTFREIGWFKAKGTSTAKALAANRGIASQAVSGTVNYDCMLWRRTFSPAIEIQPGGEATIQITFISK